MKIFDSKSSLKKNQFKQPFIKSCKLPVLTCPASWTAVSCYLRSYWWWWIEEDEYERIDSWVRYHWHSYDSFYRTKPRYGAPGGCKDLLSDELIHHVGKVGDDEDDHHCQGQIGDLHLGPGEVAALHASWQVDSYWCPGTAQLEN